MSFLGELFGPRTDDQRFPSIAAMEQAARRRTPRFAYDYMAGGIGAEEGLARNVSDFARVKFVPRYLSDPEPANLETTILGQTVAAPFAPGPVGLTGLMWPDAPLHIARAAKAHGLPSGLSSVATNSVEEVGEILGDRLWFQLYPMRDAEIEADILKRYQALGGEILLVTVDIPGPTRRQRDIRNGLAVPPRRHWSTYFQGAMRPRWALETLKTGMPRFKTLTQYEDTANNETTAEFLGRVLGGHNPPDRLKRYRELWPGKLVIKGLLGLEDVRVAQEIGADGVIISNHGARQLDAAPTAVDVLPAIRQAVGGSMAILVDGGVRTGLDIARYLAIGADFVLMGRPLAYSVAAMGARGPHHALEILKQEFATTLMQIGCSDPRELGRFLYEG